MRQLTSRSTKSHSPSGPVKGPLIIDLRKQGKNCWKTRLFWAWLHRGEFEEGRTAVGFAGTLAGVVPLVAGSWVYRHKKQAA